MLLKRIIYAILFGAVLGGMVNYLTKINLIEGWWLYAIVSTVCLLISNDLVKKQIL